MKCPYCQHKKSITIDSRKDRKPQNNTAISEVTYRYRQCCECNKKFTTYEVWAEDLQDMFENAGILFSLKQIINRF